MRIGELAKRSGLSRDTIRYYERQGIIASVPEDGASNTYRDYPEDTLMTLEVVADAQAAGMTISDLVIFLGQLDAEASEAGEDFDSFTFLDNRIAEVETRITRSRRFLKTLKDTKEALRRAPYPD